MCYSITNLLFTVTSSDYFVIITVAIDVIVVVVVVVVVVYRLLIILLDRFEPANPDSLFYFLAIIFSSFTVRLFSYSK